MAGNDSRRGAVDMGMVLMVLAFAVIGGFLFWLSGQAAMEREMAVVVDTTTSTEGPDESVPIVTGEEIQMDATPFEGQEIRLASFNVASLLGTQGFWLEMPNGNPFLVSMSSEVMAEGTAVAPQSSVTVVGTVHAMSDSVLTAWTDAGTIAEGDRIVAEFATHYLQADNVTVAGGGAGSGAGN
jgi:hypothetical protein